MNVTLILKIDYCLKPFYIQHSTFNIQHSAFNIQHSAFNIQHSTFSIQHSAFSKPHRHLRRQRMPQLLVGGTALERVVKVDTHVLLGPPFEVEGEIVCGGFRNLPVANIVIVAEQRTNALLHVALAPPPHVEPVADESVQSPRLHHIHRINRHRIVLSDARDALQVLRTGRPVLAKVFRASRPTVARRFAFLVKRIVAVINRPRQPEVLHEGIEIQPRREILAQVVLTDVDTRTTKDAGIVFQDGNTLVALLLIHQRT